MKTIIERLREPPIYFHLMAALAVLFGFITRFNGLGLSSLSVDEYYLAKSIFNVAAHGIPSWETGGYYTRGLVQQYLTVPLLWANLDMEWAMRFWPVVANALALPALYLICKSVANYRIACVAVILFSLSVWEIEFSRFARMYTPFQAIFLWYAYFMMRAFNDGAVKYLNSAFALSFLACFVYDGGLFLLALNFVILFSPHFRSLYKFLVIPISFLLAYHFFGYLVAYEGPAKLPEELETNEKAYIEFGAILPELLIFAMMKSWQWLLVWMLPAAFTTYLILNYLKRPERFRFDTLLLSLCAISALFNLIAFSIICLATAIVMRPTEENTFQAYARKTQLYPLFALISVCSIVWVSYGLLNSDWLGEISNLDYDKYPNRVTQLGSLLINYPETVSRFLIPWFNAMPLNSLLLFVGLGAAILLNICQPERSNAHFRIIFALLVASLLFVSLVDTIQKTTRYSFFIYPLLIIFLSVSLSQLDRFFPRHLNETSSIALLASAFVFMVLSDDFSLKHMANINSPEYVYRTAYPLKQGNHYYPRRDFESPGTYVNEHLQPGEIVISEVTPTDLYLKKRMDYIYMPMEEHRFWQRAVFGATLDRWTNANLIYRLDDLFETVEKAQNPVWLVTFSKDWNLKDIATFRERYAASLVFESEDHTIDVFYILPNKQQ